jgi:hypothetical protein
MEGTGDRRGGRGLQSARGGDTGPLRGHRAVETLDETIFSDYREEIITEI